MAASRFDLSQSGIRGLPAGSALIQISDHVPRLSDGHRGDAMMTLYLLQAVVPLILIAWLTFAAPRSVIGFWAQALGIGAGLVAISASGIWAFPPWWAPGAFGALLFASVVCGHLRHRDRRLWPRALAGWLSLFAFVSLGLYALNESRAAFAGRELPRGRVIEIASPLGPGVYLAANGGSNPLVNAHAAFLDFSIVQRRAFRGIGYGVDLVAIDRWGFRADGFMPADPSRYEIFGRPVVAPCDAEVMTAIDGLPDMRVPQVDADHLAGNHVILRCAGADILLGHFRQGSIRVRAGQPLLVGAAIAQVGNSGNTSEPHLHVSAQQPGTAKAPFSGAPIPIRIDGRYLVRNDRLVTRPLQAGPPATDGSAATSPAQCSRMTGAAMLQARQ